MPTNTKTISSEQDLDAAWTLSGDRPVFLFKHSTRCGISTRALKQYEKAIQAEAAGGAEWFLLDLIRHRDLSAEIAKRSGVSHQSPQAILLKRGAAVWNASHGTITAKALLRAIQAAERK